jgi:hypothetical protein
MSGQDDPPAFVTTWIALLFAHVPANLRAREKERTAPCFALSLPY